MGKPFPFQFVEGNQRKQEKKKKRKTSPRKLDSSFVHPTPTQLNTLSILITLLMRKTYVMFKSNGNGIDRKTRKQIINVLERISNTNLR